MKFRNPDGDEATLTYSKDRGTMFGTMHTKAGKTEQGLDLLENAFVFITVNISTGRIFALKKKAKGSGHVWKEFKAEFNANETEDDVTIEWNNGAGRKGMYPRTTDTTTKVTISIMFYYTDAFANLTSDIVTYIDHVLDIANQGYINSGLPITVFQEHKKIK